MLILLLCTSGVLSVEDIASVMRHRVFDDDKDYEIDKYDIQVTN